MTRESYIQELMGRCVFEKERRLYALSSMMTPSVSFSFPLLVVVLGELFSQIMSVFLSTNRCSQARSHRWFTGIPSRASLEPNDWGTSSLSRSPAWPEARCHYNSILDARLIWRGKPLQFKHRVLLTSALATNHPQNAQDTDILIANRRYPEEEKDAGASNFYPRLLVRS